MKAQSAGIILYRLKNERLEVLMAHMGSPWWAKKDKGAWTIPKGGFEEGEEPLQTAYREFKEELGFDVPAGQPIPLGTIDQKNNKTVTAWAIEGDLDVAKIQSNMFEIEWPPRSGKKQMFPEIDRAAWLSPSVATQKIIPEQTPLIERLCEHLKIEFEPATQEPDPPEQKQASLF